VLESVAVGEAGATVVPGSGVEQAVTASSTVRTETVSQRLRWNRRVWRGRRIRRLTITTSR
jgi:hypothetical protein